MLRNVQLLQEKQDTRVRELEIARVRKKFKTDWTVDKTMNDLQFLTGILKFQRILLTKKRDESDVHKVWIRYFGVLHHQHRQPGRSKEKLSSAHYAVYFGVAHRKIGFRLFVHRFRLAFWSIKSFELWIIINVLSRKAGASSQTLVRSILSSDSSKQVTKVSFNWAVSSLSPLAKIPKR